MNKQGSVILVSGPSGAGKDTILEQVLLRYPDLKFSVSEITRPRRSESDDLKYRFLTNEEFEQGIRENAYLEYAQYCGCYYGTPAAPVARWRSQGYDVIIECDVQGALQIMEKLPQAVGVFILPPSMEVLCHRLSLRRTESEEQTAHRLEVAAREIAQAHHYDFVVVNDDLQDAVDQFCHILEALRAKVENNKNLIEEVLQKC